MSCRKGCGVGRLYGVLLPYRKGYGVGVPMGFCCPKCGVGVPKCLHLGQGPYGVLMPHRKGFGVGGLYGVLLP